MALYFEKKGGGFLELYDDLDVFHNWWNFDGSSSIQRLLWAFLYI